MSRVLAVVAAGLFLVTATHASAAPALSPVAAVQSASAVAAKVKAKLDAEPDLKNHSISVTESKGTVTLEGEAPSVLGRAKAGKSPRTPKASRRSTTRSRLRRASQPALSNPLQDMRSDAPQCASDRPLLPAVQTRYQTARATINY